MKNKLNHFLSGSIILCCFLFMGFGISNLNAQNTITVPFTTLGTQTWQVPDGVTSITVECWGGGGAGGYVRYMSERKTSGGGSGGAYASRTITVTPLSNVSIYVGKGASNGYEYVYYPTWDWVNTYTASESSYVIYNSSTQVLAVGGTSVSGLNNTTGATAPSTGCVGETYYYGGNGGNGHNNKQKSASGGGGGAANRTGNGGNGGNASNNTAGLAGAAGTGGGAGGAGGVGKTDDGMGNNGGYYGGGAGGSKTNTHNSGGGGAQGYVLITYTEPTAITANNDYGVFDADAPAAITISPLTNDVITYCTSPTVTISTNPSYGSASVSGTNIIYTPNASSNNDSFTYTVTCNGVSQSATIYILKLNTTSDSYFACSGNNVSLQAAANTYFTFRWYNAATGGTLLSSSNPYSYTQGSGNGTVYLQAVGGGNEVGTRKSITITNDVTAPTITTSITSLELTGSNCTFTVSDLWSYATNSDASTTTLSQSPIAGTTITGNTTGTLTVTDVCGNSASKDILLTIPTEISTTITSHESNCYNVSDGVIIGTISNGKKPYSVALTGAATENQSGNTTGTFSFNNLPDGNYSVTVTDANGCSTINSNITIAQIATSLDIAANSDTKTFDGTELTADGYTLTFGTETYNVGAAGKQVLLNNDTVIVVITGTQTNQGASDNNVTSYQIKRGNNNITCYYNVNTTNGTLIVNKKDLTITINDSKNYDGSALTTDYTKATAPSLATGDAFTAGEFTTNNSALGTYTYAGSTSTLSTAFATTMGITNYNVTFSVTQEILDSENPTVTCPATSHVQCLADIPTTLADYTEFTAAGGIATDNHGIVTSTFYLKSNTGTGTQCDSTITRVYAIKDGSNNEGTCNHTISLKDNTKPTFTKPADLTLCRDFPSGNIVTPIAVTGDVTDEADNCSTGLNATWRDVDTTNADYQQRVILREWSLIDHCGNVALDTQKITVNPAISSLNSTFTCPSDLYITLLYGVCDTAPNYGAATFTSTIPGYDMSTCNITNDAPVRMGVDTIIVTYTVTDPCHFTMTCTQIVGVKFPPCGIENGVMYTADIDGDSYATVRVGCNCWTAENLHNTHYADSDLIMGTTYYNNDQELLAEYGRLYNWNATVRADASGNPTTNAAGFIQGVCPNGWVVPTQADFTLLLTDANGADMLKSNNPKYWLGLYGGVTPNSGFDALPAGYYDVAADRFNNLLGESYFWTTENTTYTYEAICSSLHYYCTDMLFPKKSKGFGFSVRCIKENY